MPIIMKDGIAYSSGSQTQEMKLAEYLALDPSEISNDTIYFITDTNEDLNQAFNGGFVVNLTLVNENSFTVDVEYANILKEYRQGSTIWFAESSQGLKLPVLQVTDEYAYASMVFNTIDDPKMAMLTLHSNGQGYIQYGDVAYNKEQVDFVLDETGKIIGYKTSVGGADTVFPFKSGEISVASLIIGRYANGDSVSTHASTNNTEIFTATSVEDASTGSIIVNKDCTVKLFTIATQRGASASATVKLNGTAIVSGSAYTNGYEQDINLVSGDKLTVTVSKPDTTYAAFGFYIVCI